MHGFYDYFKDFAGPVVTLIAALVAAGFTIRLGHIQSQISASQRDIALDKLKSDLFKNRYDIYQATKELLEYVPFVTETVKIDATKVRNLYVKLDEARFYFPPALRTYLASVHSICETFFITLARRENTNIDDPQWARLGEELAKIQAELRRIYADLPAAFEHSLSFKQLTRQDGPIQDG
jgi:hypothetical protein